MQVVCPPPAALTSLPAQACAFDFDQLVRLVFQRAGRSTFTAATILLKATWTPLIVAADNTKIVASPIFAGAVIPQSTALTQGGNDNSTFNGIPDYNGEGFVEVTGTINSVSPAVLKALRTLTQESLANAVGATNLSAYFVNRNGQIFADQPAMVPQGFKIYNLSFSTPGSEGYNAKNKVQFRFALTPQWFDNAVAFTPTDFDALSGDIAPAAA